MKEACSTELIAAQRRIERRHFLSVRSVALGSALAAPSDAMSDRTSPRPRNNNQPTRKSSPSSSRDKPNTGGQDTKKPAAISYASAAATNVSAPIPATPKSRREKIQPRVVPATDLPSSSQQSSQVLDGFLLMALRNAKDRLFMLKLDKDLEAFLQDTSRQRMELPPMNSYHRLIIHRVAQYFKLAHVVDSSRSVVILFKTQETEMPVFRFTDLVEEDLVGAGAESDTDTQRPEQQQQQQQQQGFQNVKIMRRRGPSAASSSTSEQAPPTDASATNPNDAASTSATQATLEEREAEYQRARARIFDQKQGDAGEQERAMSSASDYQRTDHDSQSDVHSVRSDDQGYHGGRRHYSGYRSTHGGRGRGRSYYPRYDDPYYRPWVPDATNPMFPMFPVDPAAMEQMQQAHLQQHQQQQMQMAAQGADGQPAMSPNSQASPQHPTPPYGMPMPGMPMGVDGSQSFQQVPVWTPEMMAMYQQQMLAMYGMYGVPSMDPSQLQQQQPSGQEASSTEPTSMSPTNQNFTANEQQPNPTASSPSQPVDEAALAAFHQQQQAAATAMMMQAQAYGMPYPYPQMPYGGAYGYPPNSNEGGYATGGQHGSYRSYRSEGSYRSSDRSYRGRGGMNHRRGQNVSDQSLDSRMHNMRLDGAAPPNEHKPHQSHQGVRIMPDESTLFTSHGTYCVEPPQVSHILELYNFASGAEPDISRIAVPNAAVKKSSHGVFAVFKSGALAREALDQHSPSAGFSMRPWNPKIDLNMSVPPVPKSRAVSRSETPDLKK